MILGFFILKALMKIGKRAMEVAYNVNKPHLQYSEQVWQRAIFLASLSNQYLARFPDRHVLLRRFIDSERACNLSNKIINKVEDYMQLNSWEFPVTKKSLFFYKENGALQEVNKNKAVVRTDTDQHLATVSNAYNLVTHKQILDLFDPFSREFGEPTKQVKLSANGARMIATYDYKYVGAQVAKGDTVGFRYHVLSGYDAKTSVILKGGGLRLLCTNGMIGFNNGQGWNTVRYSHRNAEVLDIQLPKIDEVLADFKNNVAIWKQFHETDAKAEVKERITADLIELKGALIPESRHTLISDQIQDSATLWDIYNHLTYDITHTQRANEITKTSRLQRVSDLFRDYVVA